MGSISTGHQLCILEYPEHLANRDDMHRCRVWASVEACCRTRLHLGGREFPFSILKGLSFFFDVARLVAQDLVDPTLNPKPWLTFGSFPKLG